MAMCDALIPYYTWLFFALTIHLNKHKFKDAKRGKIFRRILSLVGEFTNDTKEEGQLRNYQLKKNNPYRLDQNLYMRMIYIVRDYHRMKELINDVAGGFPVSSSPASNGQYADPTLSRTIKIERISEECTAIEKALEQIPQEYRKAIFDNICFGNPYPLYADASTYSRWRGRFLYYIANKLLYI